jgi:hypothetical protein
MDPPITYAELVEAVALAHRGINRGQLITMDTWDRILPTLIQAHSLCGSTTRILIRRMFDATYVDQQALTEALDQLHRNFLPDRARIERAPNGGRSGSREPTAQLKLI